MGKDKPPIGHHLKLGAGLLLLNDNKCYQKPNNNKIQASFLFNRRDTQLEIFHTIKDIILFFMSSEISTTSRFIYKKINSNSFFGINILLKNQMPAFKSINVYSLAITVPVNSAIHNFSKTSKNQPDKKRVMTANSKRKKTITVEFYNKFRDLQRGIKYLTIIPLD